MSYKLSYDSVSSQTYTQRPNDNYVAILRFSIAQLVDVAGSLKMQRNAQTLTYILFDPADPVCQQLPTDIVA